jgi:tol-pal system protein YbgF
MVSALFSPNMSCKLRNPEKSGRILKMKMFNLINNRLSTGMPLAFLGLAFFLAFATPVLAQSKDLSPILDRLQRLERDIRTLNIQVAGGGAGAGGGAEAGTPAAARIAVRLSELEDELRTTTGKVETIANQIEQVGLRLDKLIADLDYRLSALEGGTRQGINPQVSAAPSPPGVQKVVPGANQPGVLGTISQSEVPAAPGQDEEQQSVATAPVSSAVTSNALVEKTSVLPEGTPKERYTFAFGLLREANYDEAEVALAEFLKAHPNDPLAGNARYWLAESYYVRGQYVQAAEAFVTGYQAAANGPKAPDMLLKLGMSMSNLDKKQEACASFGKLLKDFPDAPERIISKVTFESNKVGCE